MNVPIKAFAILPALMLSTNVSAMIITYDLSFTGDLSGTGVFIYDDTAGSEAVHELSWDFGGGLSGNVLEAFWAGFSTTGAISVFETITGVPENVISGFAISLPNLSGFPSEEIGFYRPKTLGGAQQWTACGTGGGVGSGNCGLPNIYYQGEYSAALRSVPEPSTLGLLGAGLTGFWIRRKCAA